MTAYRIHLNPRPSTAYPPIFDVPTGEEWRAQHNQPRRWWPFRKEASK